MRDGWIDTISCLAGLLYAIVGQNLEPSPGQVQVGPPFLCRKGERRAFEIRVPEDIKGPALEIDEASFPVASSKYFTKGE
jgi:hypothetical protein